MQNLQLSAPGIQELDPATLRGTNGGLIDLGLLKIDLVNTDGKINIGITIDPGGLSLPGGGTPGSGGPGNILSPVTSLLNSLLGGLGGLS